MHYPPEVLTRSKKGRLEVRKLIDRGEFVRYEYLDPETAKRNENKVKLVLKTRTGDEQRLEEYFVVPMKNGRFLMLPAEEKGARKLWNGEKAVDI